MRTAGGSRCRARRGQALPSPCACRLSSPSEETPTVLKQATIVIAEDDPRMLKLVRRTLELEGYRVLAASDGRQALELALGPSVDLVLLDVMMPEMDGFTVAQKIRTASAVPILMLTARAAE